jgi:hypothetical protein
VVFRSFSYELILNKLLAKSVRKTIYSPNPINPSPFTSASINPISRVIVYRIEKKVLLMEREKYEIYLVPFSKVRETLSYPLQSCIVHHLSSTHLTQ